MGADREDTVQAAMRWERRARARKTPEPIRALADAVADGILAAARAGTAIDRVSEVVPPVRRGNPGGNGIYRDG